MSDSEDDASLIRENFNKTTTRLVSECVQSSGMSSELVKSKSFKKFVRHLNPLALIPSASDIEQKDGSRVRATPILCIVCQRGDPVDGVTLSLDHAALILIGTLMGTSNPNIEVARRLQSTSLRMCHSHIPEVFKKMFKSLKIESTKKLRHVKMGVLEKWRDMFLEIKKFHTGEKEENFDAAKLVAILQKFINNYYESEGPTPRPLPSTMRQLDIVESEEEEEDEEEKEEDEEEVYDDYDEKEEYPSRNDFDDIMDSPHSERRAFDDSNEQKSWQDIKERIEPTLSTFPKPKEESPELDDEPWPTASSYLSSEQYKRVIRDAASPPQRRERETRPRYSPS